VRFTRAITASVSVADPPAGAGAGRDCMVFRFEHAIDAPARNTEAVNESLGTS